MLTDTVVAAFLLGCLAFFVPINLYNILVVHGRKRGVKSYAEVERPSGLSVSLAAIGTFVYFIEVVMYLFLVFTGSISLFRVSPFDYQLPFRLYLQTLGLALTMLGYFMFIWSVVARGRYAVSWEMPRNQRLVTWGPYRYVRHPSYLGYFFMFFGFFFLVTNLFTVFPLLAIPGYYHVSIEEERLLIQRFGKEYVQYQRKTGMFFPKLR